LLELLPTAVRVFPPLEQAGVASMWAGLYEMTWRTGGKRKGAHVLTAVASDIRGREAEANQTVRVCK